MKNLLIALFVILSILSTAEAQRFSVSGYLKDATSGEALIGANVMADSTATGTTANHYGFYSLSLSTGYHVLKFSYIGYTTQRISLFVSRDTSLYIMLEPGVAMKGIEVKADAVNTSTQSSRMGTVELRLSQIKKLPSLLGEADLLKAVQLLPGVQSGNEGTSGFYVRGGGPDQNLILLDGVPVYNANHLFGFFSVFNNDAINHVELVKGGFPARYGGRLSSVLDISMKEGNMKKLKITGTLGLIASKLTIEGPIIKDKTSFIVSGRRTYIDYLAQPLMQMESNNYSSETGYYFSDINTKVNHIFSAKDRIFLSVYSGNDKFYEIQDTRDYLYEGEIYKESGQSKLGWGNLTSALRWTHQYNGKLFGNATLTYSNYKFYVKQDLLNFEINDTGVVQSQYNLDYYSGIRDYSAKYDLDFIPHPDHYIKSGISFTRHIFRPGASVTSSKTGADTTTEEKAGTEDIPVNEVTYYAEDDFRVTDKLKINGGMHFSGFLLKEKSYFSAEPRLSARYLLTPALSLKASYSYMSQFVHLLTNSNIGLPTDLWVPATASVPPMKSSQVSLGLSLDLPRDFQFTFETYYKTMKNVIEYKEGASFMSSYTNWESKVESGKGWGYGAEFFLQKKTGDLTGWLGYTWAHSDRKFPFINDGKTFPYKFDRRHDISFVLNYQIDPHWDVSLTWVYGTGTAITMPTVEYLVINDMYGIYPVQSYDKRNSYRTAPYHRLDIGFNNVKDKKWGQRTWSFGLYNAYNRKNPFYYQIVQDYTGKKALQRTALFPIIPSVSYTFRIGK